MNIIAWMDGLLVLLALVLAGAPVRLAAGQRLLPGAVPALKAVGLVIGVLGLGLAPLPGHSHAVAVRILAGLLGPAVAWLSVGTAQTGRGAWVALCADVLLVLGIGLPGLRHTWPVFLSNLLHLAGAAAWLGGLCWYAMLPGTPEERQRFSTAAALGLTLSLLAGLGVTFAERDHGYAANGTVLMAKHLMLIPLLAFGWYHNQGRGSARTLRAEAVLGLAVLCAGLALTLAPPGQILGPGAVKAAAAARPADNLPGWAITNAIPPTTGATGAPMPTMGVHQQAIPEAQQVAALAAGAILLQYNCTCPDLAEKARELTMEYPDQVILAPYSKATSRLSLTAWGRILTLDRWDEVLVRRFIIAHKGKGKSP